MDSIRFTDNPSFFDRDKETRSLCNTAAQTYARHMLRPHSAAASLRLSLRVVRTNHCERTWTSLMIMGSLAGVWLLNNWKASLCVQEV